MYRQTDGHCDLYTESAQSQRADSVKIDDAGSLVTDPAQAISTHLKIPLICQTPTLHFSVKPFFKYGFSKLGAGILKIVQPPSPNGVGMGAFQIIRRMILSK